MYDFIHVCTKVLDKDDSIDQMSCEALHLIIIIVYLVQSVTGSTQFILSLWEVRTPVGTRSQHYCNQHSYTFLWYSYQHSNAQKQCLFKDSMCNFEA